MLKKGLKQQNNALKWCKVCEKKQPAKTFKWLAPDIKVGAVCGECWGILMIGYREL